MRLPQTMLAAACCACSGGAATGAGPATRPPDPPARVAATAPIPAATPPPDAGSDAPPAPPAPGDFVGAPFPPADFEPPSRRSAREGDGIWTPVEGTAREGRAAVYRAVVHPHRISKYLPVVIAAIDLARVDVRLRSGTEGPATEAVAPEKRTGLVPAADQPDLLAAFNGGFKTRHGRYGMMVDGDVLVPPREDVCTVALQRDRTVRIRPWSEVAGTAGELIAYRQTPPCLLVDGKIHAGLDATTRRWGISIEGKVKVRRSAVGLDPSGRTLFYAVGEESTARLVALGLRAAGAVDAAQLDINWSYTWFLFYGRGDDGRLEVRSTLIPKMKHRRRGLVEKPAYRDFFYLKWRGAHL